MLDKVISWGDLITVVLFLLGVALLLFLVFAVANLVGILSRVRKMLDDTAPKLRDTMTQVPKITENVAKLTTQVTESMDDVQKLLTNVSKISDTATSAADTIKNDIVLKVKGILDATDGIRRFFLKREEKALKKKSSVYRYTYSKEQPNPDSIVIEKSVDSPVDADVSPDTVTYTADAEKE